ncbi:MAG: phage/plasmid primase, P4 family [Sphingobium sp.]
MHDMISYALTLYGNGYVPLRAEPNEKATRYNGWQAEMPSEESIRRRFARPSNIGIRCGDLQPDGTCLVAIDVDLEEAELVRCVEKAIGIKVPIKRGRKGWTYFIRIDEETKSSKVKWVRDGKGKSAIDIIARGGQTIVPPSIHPDTGSEYQWIGEQTLLNTDYRALPVFGPSVIDEIRGFCRNAADPIYALNDMEWCGVGGGGNTHDTGLSAVASMVARQWSEEEIHERIHRAKREASERAGMPYNWPEGQKVIQGWIDSARDKKFDQSGRKSKRLSHGVVADNFLPHARDHYRYDRDLNDWYFFDGSYWRGKSGYRLRNAIDLHVSDELRNSHFISGVEISLRNRPEFTTLQHEWDPDPYLLSTPGGVIDLRTGITRPSMASDLITRCTSVAAEDSYEGCLWVSKVSEWVGDSPDELAYFQKLAGLFLIGLNPEACLPMWLGTGGDGKSVIANTYRHILGDYARTSTDTAFLDNRQGQHHEEIAWLKGSRLVLVNEINGSLPWNDARIKAVTGGESQSASFKGGHLFEYRPEYKLLITGNEAPNLRSVGPEFRRRFHVLKFNRGVANPDRYLSEKFKAEAGAILRWMIDGAVRYCREGLEPSPLVKAATAEYFEDHDTIQQWRNDRTEDLADHREKADDIYRDYRDWATDQGFLYPLTRPKFTAKLRTVGVICKPASLPGERNSVRCYFGLRLIRALPGY